MPRTIISEGKTSTEAIEKGLKKIGLPKELVEIKVIEENKKSFFDILAPKVVKVELKEKEAKKPEEFEIETTEQELEVAKAKLTKFLTEFVEKLNNGTTYNIEIKEKCLYVTISGENVGNLIGYRGDALYAIESLLKVMANQNAENRVINELKELGKPFIVLLNSVHPYSQETEELTAFIGEIREKFKITILLIEHHMNLVMNISDRIYVIDFGRQIAAGVPAEIQNDQRVIDAYLGVDEDG